MKEFQFVDKALYVEKEKILVITDLHIGYEEALSSAGVFFPRRQFDEMVENLERIFKFLNEKEKEVKEIVILGDLKHEFGSVLKQEWREVFEFLDYLKKKGKIVLVRGNHDAILKPIAEKKEIDIVDYYIKENICFVHGDKVYSECLDKKIKTIIMGHKHPAITIRRDVKSERYKCFLVGKWKRKQVIIMPSFFPLVEGSDVFVDDTNLAFKMNLKNFEVYVPVDESKALNFEKVKDIGRLN